MLKIMARGRVPSKPVRQHPEKTDEPFETPSLRGQD
jgi:hypothetical protein